MAIFRNLLICLLLLLFLTNVYAAPVTITNGIQIIDTNGNLVQAHGGGVIKVGSYYYWFGENNNANDTFYAVSCYRSTDLKTWEFRNNVLTQSSSSELNTAVIERPKVIYCASTGKYVMWMHKENGVDYSEARAAVAYCSTVDGNYTFVGSFQPLNNMSRDCTLFTDNDQTAYFISSANNNADLHVYKLSNDYLSIASLVQKLFVGQMREAPCMFQRNGYYYLITSFCTGWSPNQQMYSYATSISGTWSALTNIGDSTCFNSQGTYVLPVQGSSTTSYLFMGDRWAGAWGGKVNDSSYVWLPITFNSNTSLAMNWSDSINIDNSTGIISVPTNLALNKTASADSSASGYGAANGNDGKISTRWCANDGNTGHWWKVDLGSNVNIGSTQVTWEFSNAYKYKIDVSTDNSTWTTKVDKSGNATVAQVMVDNFSATARYVRVTVTGLPSGCWASFFEFGVYGSDGSSPTPTPTPTPTSVPGSNLALNKAAGADSEESGNGASAGNDGNTSTRWCANDGNLNHWWKVDLGANYNLTGSQVMWEINGVYKYKIEVSTDNANWTLKSDKTGNTTSAQTISDSFTAAARYVRITVTGLPSSKWASFFEFSVFGSGSGPTPTPTPTPTPNPSNLALNKTASADSSAFGYGPASGNDGNTSTRWCANDGNTGHWWKVDLGSSVSITGTQVMWEFTGAYKYKIEVSTDNTNWTLKADKTGNTTSAQTMSDSFTATARYVRITVTGLQSGQWASFFEFSVFGSGGSSNLAGNPGFETGSLSPWTAWNNAIVSSSNQRSGSYCLQLTGGICSAEQVISGLSPNTTYTLTGYAKVTSGNSVRIGVKNFGGTEINTLITSTSYAQGTVTFTTGGSNTSATIYVYQDTGTGSVYGDDILLTR